MIISVLNLSHGVVTNAEAQKVIRAINRQIKEDFMPYWGIGATLRLEGNSVTQKPRRQSLADMRGEAILYLWDRESRDAAGYHDKNNSGIPYGVVYLNLAKELDKNWSVTFSHEALELIADPEINLMVAGPHPNRKIKRHVLHDYEMCDPVQAESYEIDGISVSNFILPLYFTGEKEFNGRNDFLGTVNPDGTTLQSFSVNPGGYIGFYDPHTHKSETHFGKEKEQTKAKARFAIKQRAKKTRRAVRYERHFRE
jgi:hypothetical protein